MKTSTDMGRRLQYPIRLHLATALEDRTVSLWTDLTKTTDADLRDTWKLDPAQIKITMSTSASRALHADGTLADGKTIGILTIDCEEDGEVSGSFSDDWRRN